MGERRERIGEEPDLERVEINSVISKLKDDKAMGIDGIPNEVWKYGGEEIREWVWKVCNKIWKGEGWPEDWKEGVVVPIIKKGQGNAVRDYRGITIMPTLYKVYVTVLAERLREEIEEGGMIPQNQTGFRKGRGTIDNIYVLNYLVNRGISRKGGKVIAFFVDLKAAFDSVDRKNLIKALRERGVREGLVERIEEMLRETRSRVRLGSQLGEGFWTARGVRQGCPLSPFLFNMLIADIEDELGKVKWGGVKIGESRIHSLLYADDMVLLAEDEGSMRSVIGRMESYLEKKGLELNTEKSKIVRFKKGGGRDSKASWYWKGKKVEEVKEIYYLGYKFKRNGGQEAQVKDRVGKAAMVMGQVWGIGKRRFGKDWKRRVWLFDKLVWTVAGYGVEIWGWEEREKMESLQERYLRWVLGVEGRTPGYLVREELQREKLRSRAGKRACKYEQRLLEGGGSLWARKCLEEVRGRTRKSEGQSGWEAERKRFFENRGEDIKEWEEMRTEEERNSWEESENRIQNEERWERIRNGNFSRFYKWVKGEGVPEYLEKGWGESRWRRVARYRMGNEMKESRYWEEEEKILCRLCGSEKETWEHVWERCRTWKEKGEGSWQEEVERVLADDGGGEKWMREVERGRKRVEGGGEESECEDEV